MAIATTAPMLTDLDRQARLAAVRRDNAVAQAVLEGSTQVDVASALGITQPAVSQMLRHRRERTLGSYWTIPVTAARVAAATGGTNANIMRCCAQFVADFRRITDPIDQEQALGAPDSTGAQRLDCLIAGLADREARRAGLSTPAWTISARYDMFPSWFIAPNAGLGAYLMSVTPPEFSVRGVFLDPRDLESL